MKEREVSTRIVPQLQQNDEGLARGRGGQYVVEFN